MNEDAIFQKKLLDASTSSFEPKADLSDKHNYCRHIFVERDGSISEVVRLNVWDDRHREDIIGFHFSQQYAEIHYGGQPEQPQFYVVGRDSPWDFEYVMHDGSGFFLEVCRVADHDLFKAMKAENDIAQLLLKDELAGFEIKKIEKLFPGTLPKELVEAAKLEIRGKFPFDSTQGAPKLFVRPPMNPQLDLTSELGVALKKKANKNHAGKEKTIIVIDNLTTHSDPEEFFQAFESLGDHIDNLPFKSIWLYTGYYSDDDGYNCEFSLIPMKLPDEQADYFSQNLSS